MWYTVGRMGGRWRGDSVAFPWEVALMRVLVADDQARVRSALRLLLDQEPDICICGEASDAWVLLDQVKATGPDLVLLDWELPGSQAGEVLRTLRQSHPALRVVALSGRPEARRAALLAGADGFVSKGDPPEELVRVLRDCGRVAPASSEEAMDH
jgi:DNA-binding NarL/FixJ family response regulator